MHFQYHLNNDALDTYFIETGVRPSKHQMVDLDDVTASKEVRAIFIGISNSPNNAWLPNQDKILQAEDVPGVLLAMQSAKEAIEAEAKEELSQLLSKVETIDLGSLHAGGNYLYKCESLCNSANLPQSYLDGLKAKINADRAAFNAREEEQEKAAAILAESQAQALLNAKAQWIETHGSEHLKRAFKHGYDCRRQYVEERIAIEYPGFCVDWDDNADWTRSSCPTGEALDALDKLPAGFGIGDLTQRHDYDPEADWLIPPGRDKGEILFLQNYLNLGVDILKYL